MATPKVTGNETGRVPAPAVEHREGASRRSRLLAVFLRVFVRPVLAAYGRLPKLPWPFGLIDRMAFVLRARHGTERSAVRLPNCRAEWVHAKGAGSRRAVLYLHGGAFVCCGLRTHRRLASEMSAAAGGPVLNVDYRMLTAAVPISAAVADGVDGYRWLLDQGFGREEIVIAGDSAGGYLAFQVALAVAGQGLPAPAAVVAMSPLTDLDPSAKLAHPNARLDPVFPPAVLTAVGELAERVAGERGNGMSPVDADLGAMPPTLIQAGSTELLLPDAELMARRLAGAGVAVRLQVWERQVHVFQAAADLIPEGRTAIGEIRDFLDEVAG
ncbi:alpha/beta hydrolase [Amycolatopsis cihanbeyliensis]|uniref:Acetyl esterase/lipase n=1 Tax=Amycolatopsis cihanbeyliensis TaxID=1128664 RepID=A0A542DQT7_AMYCI|nr:alpha/beta hydrolase fold domain-containing protein [Amycolatopsis cihanbeyliensis]TQJ05470.1 acetyl esterase/lipase [Amycolatopsis cihanbeyliensis]